MNILGLIGGILVIVGGAVTVANAYGQLNNDNTKQDGRIDGIEVKVDNFSGGLTQALKESSAAKNDAAATRAFTTWIVRRLGEDPNRLWKDPEPTATSSSLTTINNNL